MKKENIPFDKRIMKAGVIPNLVSAALVFSYAAIFISMRLVQLPWAILIVGGIVLFAEFVFSPLTNGLLTKKLTERITDWQENGIADYKERTQLFEAIMSFPYKKGIQTFLYFFVCAVLMALGYYLVPQMGLTFATDAVSFIACIFGSYFAGLLALDYSEHICEPMAQELVAQGIDAEYVQEKKQFSLSMYTRMVLYLIIPVLYSAVLLCIVLFEGYFTLNGHIPTAKEQIIKIIVVEVINLSLCLLLVQRYSSSIRKSNIALAESLVHSLKTGDANQYIGTSISNRMQYNIWLLNNVISRFNTLLTTADNVAEKVLHTTDSLSVISGQLSSTSLEQSAAVKEILTTMEDSSALTQNIANTIESVSASADDTYQSVTASFDALESITSQMNEIHAANDVSIAGIQELEKQVENIGKVISIINDIADQTRIIAFNAELEAVSAGDEGQSFHIVATEIRRLAGSTMNSITEIKEYIENIQQAANRLISTSRMGTETINQESELITRLQEQFNSIKNLADITADQSTDISSLVGSQSASFGQIVITLRQIASSIESFAGMTATINDTAVNMQDISKTLRDIEFVSQQ
ncbi:MAG: methyl-accepting chemotaxis protein [Treponemataceae bacterium]|nr:methyl-accepting chemotaxis protein [Treponemataceae bacterium]